MRAKYPLCLILLCCFCWSLSAQEEAINAQANRVVEISFRAEKSRSNPFLEIELDVVFTDPQETQFQGDNHSDPMGVLKFLKFYLTRKHLN